MYIPLWIIVIGAVVYFFWAKNKKEQPDQKKGMTSPLNDKKTSTNPLFSEKEIADAEKLFASWRKEYEESFARFQKKVVEETKKFDAVTINFSGKSRKESFVPSKDLLRAIGRNTLARFCADFAKHDHEKMIESNIAITNGKEIAVVEKEFYNSKKSNIPYYNLDVVYNDSWWTRGGQIEKEYKEDVERILGEYWNKNWDSIK